MINGVIRAFAAATVASLCVCTAAVSANALPAKGGKPILTGTISWTKATESDSFSPESPDRWSTGSSKLTATMELAIRLRRLDKKTYVFTRAKTHYSFDYTSVREGFAPPFYNPDGTYPGLCRSTYTTERHGEGVGKLQPWVFGTYKGRLDAFVLDKRTKGIGTNTVSMEGRGMVVQSEGPYQSGSPCGSSTMTRPSWGGPRGEGVFYVDDAGPGYCLPAGLKKPQSSLYVPFYGRFDLKRKSFEFGCSQTFRDKREQTTTQVTVSGFLRVKR